MADSLDEVIKVSKLLGFDYSKFENTKIAAEKRKTAGETSKMKNKKVLVSPVRTGRSVSENSKNKSGEKIRSVTPDRGRSGSQSRPASEKTPDRERSGSKSRQAVEKTPDRERSSSRSRTTFEKTSDRERSGSKSRPAFEKGNIKTNSTERLHNSGRKSVDPEKLTIAQLRKSKTEVKNRTHTECDKRKNDINGLSEEKTLREIRRKLDFEKDEIGDEVTPLPHGLDFTDKLAALRSLINRDRETRDITDRRAYYGEYKSSQRNIIISRSDSLKENQEVSEKTHLEKEKIKDSLKARRLASDRQRKVQSADLFRDKAVNGRISATELHVLKERLEGKNDTCSETKDNNVDERKVRKDNVTDKDLSIKNSLLHAKSGRKILVPSARKSLENDTSNTMEEGSMPNSRLESKETQTNQLNQSIRSVQSNVPFYETVGRPVSAPVLNCGITVGKRRTVHNNRESVLEGIDSGLNIKNNKTKSPHKDDRQTNAGDFVGTSLTPEKSKCRSSFDVENNISGKYLGSLSRTKRNRDHQMQKLDPGNHRPSSRNSLKDDDILLTYNNSGKNYKDSAQQSKSNNAVLVNKLGESKHEKTDVRSSSKSERKVREWIKSQEHLMAEKLPDGVMMEELNVSISIPTCSPVYRHPSPSDSCDKFPVKLEKQKSEKSHVLPSNTAYGIIQPHKGGNLGSLSNRQAIFDRLEHITMAVVTQQHQLELEIPVKDIQVTQDKRLERASYGTEAKSGRGTPGNKGDNWDSASTE